MENKQQKNKIEHTHENKKAMNKALSQTKGYDNEIITDPFGSYTGVPSDDPYSKPIQDVDDL